MIELNSAQLDRVLSPTVTSDLPQRIGDFDVLSVIGRGGMATVFLASSRDSEDPRTVAIKLLHRGFEGHEVRRRFYREGAILSRFRHPTSPPSTAAAPTPTAGLFWSWKRSRGSPSTATAVSMN